jgi:SAM-dependent MidA family methyltransferase
VSAVNQHEEFLAAEDGVSFADFMAYALHDPLRGYYARRISDVGVRGDFTTSAEISPALAKAVAAWAARELRETKCRDLIELGPGSGALAAAVWKELPWSLRWRTRLHLVESSAGLRERQRARNELRHVQWHETVEAALAACGGRACLYSNEFFDAFPVRVFRRQGQSWSELFMKKSEQGIMREAFREVVDLPDSTLWSISFAEGQRVEVADAVRLWLENLQRVWQAGSMVAIDYGDLVESLYYRRLRGTVRGYLAQQRIEGEGVYQNIGRQDLTADVNFSDLMHWSHGFAARQKCETQREFLLPHADSSHRGDVYAVDPLGAGSAFRVWHLGKKES